MADVLPAPATDDATAAENANAPALPPGALTVLQGGVATTVLTLAVLYWTAHNDIDFNPMGWYANYVIPAGAIMVGLVAGSGYGVMSWLKGVKIRRGLLIAVIALQFVAYWAAEYTAYLDVLHRETAAAEAEGQTVEPPGFLRYFHFKTQNFAWKKKHSDETGDPLGNAGYFFVGLAALGFIGGGLIAPLVTMNLPYCAGCQRYMKTKRLGLIPASVPYRKVKKGDAADQAAYDAEQDAGEKAGGERADELTRLATSGDAEGFRRYAEAAFGTRRATDKLPVRMSTDLVHCPGCQRGWLRHAAVVGQGKQVKSTVVSSNEVGPAFVAPTLGKPLAVAADTNTDAAADA